MERPGPSDGGFSEASTCRMGRAGRAALESPSDKAFSLFSFSNDRLRRIGTRPTAGSHMGFTGFGGGCPKHGLLLQRFYESQVGRGGRAVLVSRHSAVPSPNY